MPKFILRDDSVEVGLHAHRDGVVAIEMHHGGEANVIGFFEDGGLRLYALNIDWAKAAGVQLDADHRIKLI
jgi:hypothetical protein